MIPRRIAGANATFGAPEGWDEAADGPCVRLHARVARTAAGLQTVATARRLRRRLCAAQGARLSARGEPTPEELAALAAGGSLILTIVGGQPALRLDVECP